MSCNEGPLEMSLYFNQVSLRDMLMCEWRWTGRKAGAVRQRKERDPQPGGRTPGLTFWATWLTHGEVQLLRSGPRGFHMTSSAKQWNEAMPGDEHREKKQRRGGGSNGEIISVKCRQLKAKVRRRGMSTPKK